MIRNFIRELNIRLAARITIMEWDALEAIAKQPAEQKAPMPKELSFH